jgi:hypothetical protein
MGDSDQKQSGRTQGLPSLSPSVGAVARSCSDCYVSRMSPKHVNRPVHRIGWAVSQVFLPSGNDPTRFRETASRQVSHRR